MRKMLSSFFNAGFTQENVIEVIGGISAKIVFNYLNIIAQTKVDEIIE